MARPYYSIIIAVHPPGDSFTASNARLGEISVDWVDFTREKSVDKVSPVPPLPNTTMKPRKRHPQKPIPGSSSYAHTTHPSDSHASTPAPTPDDLSLQPLLAHVPGPHPLESTSASGISTFGRGIVHLFRHAPPPHLIAGIDSHPIGESSKSGSTTGEWAGERAEGEDGSLIAILAVPAWMRPADFLEFIGGWTTCLEGVRMIREATTPNRSIVLLKFRDPLQAADFLVIFTGRPFSTLDARETCHPIRIHHLVLHHLNSDPNSPSSTAIPAFPPSTYSSRAKALSKLLKDIPPETIYELPSCPVCLERLDSSVTGLVTLPCAHTFDCDCLRKWGDSKCPVCRISHLLLSTTTTTTAYPARREGTSEIMRLTACATCGTTSNNWICVVCGVVGCGRYEPGKAHARRHWEESGHVLAMELETQRVWDYKGDNYVHRLIQTRTDGKLVELPSASSLVTSNPPRPIIPLSTTSTPQRPSNPANSNTAFDPTHTASNSEDRSGRDDRSGPSSDDQEKMSTIEAITLEYSYLLSSQLEAMRQHYESIAHSQEERLLHLESIESKITEAETQKEQALAAQSKAEKKAEKAIEMLRSLQATLSAEKAMSEGLSVRVGKLKEQVEEVERAKKGKEEEVKGLEETVRDLMFSLEAGLKVQEGGGEGGEGGSLVVVPNKGKKGKKRGG